MFIVYHKKTTRIVKTFDLASSAQRSVTCLNRNAKSDDYSFAPQDTYYGAVVYTKKVKNMMTGEEIEIPSNTPNCCNPESETYWSM